MSVHSSKPLVPDSSGGQPRQTSHKGSSCKLELMAKLDMMKRAVDSYKEGISNSKRPPQLEEETCVSERSISLPAQGSLLDQYLGEQS